MAIQHKSAWSHALLLTLLALAVPPMVRAQGTPTAARSPEAGAKLGLPLGAWDDDWLYPEGRIKLGPQRYSLFVGANLASWTSVSAREGLGSRTIDPDLDFYRPEAKGIASDLGLDWVTAEGSKQTARILAPTIGLRTVMVAPESRSFLVPFASLRAGPYFVKSSEVGKHTVLGGNASFGLEIARQVSLSAQYHLIKKIDGVNFSNWSASALFKVPLGRPAGAAQKMKGTLPPPGDLVDVGGYSLHLVCRGRGTPTVVLDAGMSEAFITWSKVQPALAKTTRVCSYDRAGIGYSEQGPLPRTSGRIAEELHTLLHKAGIEGPYVLAGHSFGGYNVRLFASRYPKEVAGVVLVDASHEDMWRRYPPEARELRVKILEYFRKTAEKAERGKRMAPIMPNLPRQVATRAAWYRAQLEEFRSMEASGDELRASNRSLSVPLVVISAGRVQMGHRSRAVRREMGRVWGEMQAEMVGLSPQGRRIIAKKSRHHVQQDQPGIVVAAVEDVLRATRR